MKVYGLFDKNGTMVESTYADSKKEVIEFWGESLLSEFNLKIKEIGRAAWVDVNKRSAKVVRVLYKDLDDATAKNLKSIPPRMLQILVNDLHNNSEYTNTSFFMLERGLVLADRVQLSEIGTNLFKAFNK